MSLQVTGEQLKKIAYQRRITVWTAEECPVCDYPIKYIFNNEHDVKYDPGCYCNDRDTVRAIRFETSSWDLVALYINSQSDYEKEKRIKQFWGI